MGPFGGKYSLKDKKDPFEKWRKDKKACNAYDSLLICGLPMATDFFVLKIFRKIKKAYDLLICLFVF